jgi:hypothetical protein
VKKAVLSETRAACCMLRVTITMVKSLTRSFMRSSIASVEIGSSEEQGSSMRMASGCTAMARAMHRRCCWPPDSAQASWCSLSLTSSHSEARRRTASTRSSSAFRLSLIDFGNGFGFWNTMPMRRRRSTGSTSDA